jgi:hypothetical protein
MSVKSNIYLSGEVWCHATWIDGEYDGSDPMDAEDEDEARADVRRMYEHLDTFHEINRVLDEA